MNIEQKRAALDELRAEILAFDEIEAPTDDDVAALDEKVERHAALKAEVEADERRAAAIEQIRAAEVVVRTADVAAGPQIISRPDPVDVLNDRDASPTQLADAVTRSLEGRGADLERARPLLERHGRNTAWSRNLLVRSSDAYVSGFEKYMAGRHLELTDLERAAMSVGTNANGGYLVPTHLDPSLILTNDGSNNIMRQLARVVTLTEGNTWNGVTTAGVSASFDAELAEVSDDSPTVGNPSVDVHMARALVQASIEVVEDAANNLASDLLMLFGDARDRLEGDKNINGSGTNEPKGLVTCLDANTNTEIESTTAATIGTVDLDALYRSVPRRFRGRSSWLMHPRWHLAVKNLGTALSASYSTDLTQAPTDRILGRPAFESDDMPDDVTTTVADNEIIFGDFSNYVIVDKPGSTAVEYIPHLFNTSNNLPDGRRGWFYHFRTGGNSVLDTAFRILQDKTSE